MAKKSDAGKDLYKGSLILTCIKIDPVSKMASPIAENSSKLVYQIETTKPMAKSTLSPPIR